MSIDSRPSGICPDCGKSITLQPSGWWTHDGLSGDCWRSSMDGPNDEDNEPTERTSPMRFIVTLRNQSTGITRDVEIRSSYDATAVLSREAKQSMNLPASWDYVDSRRIEPLEDATEDTLTTWEREQIAAGKATRDGSGIKLHNPDMHIPPAAVLNENTELAEISGSVETFDDGSLVIKASGEHLRAWAHKDGSSWPCSRLAELDSLMIKFAKNGDLVEIEPTKDGFSRIEGSPIDIPADELSAYEQSVRTLYEPEQWQVIENTPGYMPDADEPALFDSYADAVAYANSQADELAEQGYDRIDRSQASAGNYYAIHAERSDTVAPDLGRNIAVERVEDENQNPPYTQAQWATIAAESGDVLETTLQNDGTTLEVQMSTGATLFIAQNGVMIDREEE